VCSSDLHLIKIYDKILFSRFLVTRAVLLTLNIFTHLVQVTLAYYSRAYDVFAGGLSQIFTQTAISPSQWWKLGKHTYGV